MEVMNKCTCHFCEAGRAAAAGETAVCSNPKPASQNDELTETLKRMRQMAVHNYPSKEQLNGGSNEQ